MQVEPPQLLLLILMADRAPGMLLKFKLHMQVLAEDLLTVPLQLLFQQILMAEEAPPLRAPALARKLITTGSGVWLCNSSVLRINHQDVLISKDACFQ